LSGPTPVSAAGTPCSITPVLTETDLNTCITEAPTDNSEFSIILGANFSLTAVKIITTGKNIVLGSSITGGATLSLQAGNTARHFTVQNSGQLTLASGVTLQGYGDGTTIGGGVFIDSSGTFTMQSGATISGNTATSNAGGVFVAGGTFVMQTGATINSNVSLNSGGGVAISAGGTFIINGGTISSNKTTGTGGGGGVFASNGTFTMNGGTISNNQAYYGGGAFDTYGSTFTMNGGTISDNSTSAGSGGGVTVNNSAFTMNSSATISNNFSPDYGGGISVTNAGTFVMSGGEISGNKTDVGGGGISIGSGASATIASGRLVNNIANTNGGTIWTLAENLPNLTVGIGVIFSGNSAATYARMDPADQALYNAQIFATNFSLPLPFNGYNNYDIRYTSDLPTDICQFNSSLWADDARCVAAPETGLFSGQISGATASVFSFVLGSIVIVAIWASHKLISKIV